MYENVREDVEVNDTLNELADAADRGTVNKFPGRTYEEGVEAGVRWVLGMTDDHPMDDE